MDSKFNIWLELKWNVCGTRVELKCHGECWEFRWVNMGGIYGNS